jgi:hypothetical protein
MRPANRIRQHNLHPGCLAAAGLAIEAIMPSRCELHQKSGRRYKIDEWLLSWAL